MFRFSHLPTLLFHLNHFMTPLHSALLFFSHFHPSPSGHLHVFLLSPPNLYFCSLSLSQSLKSFPSLIVFLSLLISKVLPLISSFSFHSPIHSVHSFHLMFSSSLSHYFAFLLCFPFPLILSSIASSFLCLWHSAFLSIISSWKPHNYF